MRRSRQPVTPEALRAALREKQTVASIIRFPGSVLSRDESPAFFRAVLASGLVDQRSLQEVLLLAMSMSGRPARYQELPGTVETLEEGVLADPPERPGKERPDDLDYRLADLLIKRRQLNPWQASQLLAGRTKFKLGGYWVVDSIGQGGYGQVFLGREEKDLRDGVDLQDAYHASLFPRERLLAIKVLPQARSTPEMIARFEHEVSLQSGLLHPNFVQFIDSGFDGNVHYMVHEYVDGGDLRSLLHEIPLLPFDVVAHIVMQAAEALQHLHDCNIVHRDIKPANILISTDGFAKLGDMGLALRMQSFETLPPEMTAFLNAEMHADVGSDDTQTQVARQLDRAGLKGKIAGTVDYMAPDQLHDPHSPTPRWDIYSLGCTLYQLLTGSVPFPKGETREKFRAHLKEAPPDPRIYNQSIPYDIAALTLSMLAKDPNLRIRSATEVAARLRPWSSEKKLIDLLQQYNKLREKESPAFEDKHPLPSAVAAVLPDRSDASPPLPVIPPVLPSQLVPGTTIPPILAVPGQGSAPFPPGPKAASTPPYRPFKTTSSRVLFDLAKGIGLNFLCPLLLALLILELMRRWLFSG